MEIEFRAHDFKNIYHGEVFHPRHYIIERAVEIANAKLQQLIPLIKEQVIKELKEDSKVLYGQQAGSEVLEWSYERDKEYDTHKAYIFGIKKL